MAYRRATTSLVTRATLISRTFNPSLTYISHHNNNNNDDHPHQPSVPNISNFRSYWVPTNLFHISTSGLTGLGSGVHHFCRNMSTSIGGGSDKSEYLTDVTGIINDVTPPVDSVTAIASSQVSEVAVAAADSFFPVAALHYLIDGVHSFTGFNWWASIVVTTLLIRGMTVPFLINQLKATSKLSLMRPRLEEIKEEMQTKGMDPEAVADGKRRMNNLFKEYGVTPFTPLKGIFIQGPVFISFFLAINNMAEKVPSFKNGGAFWFTDLSAPDSLYILPVLTALTFLINVEFNMQEGLEGNPIAGTMKKFSRGVAVLTVPFTMSFPQAIFCYWVTSNIFSFAYGSVLKMPGVKAALKIPEIPVAPPSTTNEKPQSGFSFFQAMKQVSQAAAENAAAVREQSHPTAPKASSSAVLTQRIKSLERQVKQRNKTKKR